MNDTQKNFLKQVADIQEEAVQIALCKYKDGDNIEDLLYDTTFDALVELMVLIDGYGACKGGYDLICRNNGESVKSNPFIELHDVAVEYLKYERFPNKLNGVKVMEYTPVGDYGKANENSRQTRYFAICQQDNDEKYFLFYCDDCEQNFNVLYSECLASIDECKQKAAQYEALYWRKNVQNI